MAVVCEDDVRMARLLWHRRVAKRARAAVTPDSGPLRAVHLSCHKWPGGLVN